MSKSCLRTLDEGSMSKSCLRMLDDVRLKSRIFRFPYSVVECCCEEKLLLFSWANGNMDANVFFLGAVCFQRAVVRFDDKFGELFQNFLSIILERRLRVSNDF